MAVAVFSATAFIAGASSGRMNPVGDAAVERGLPLVEVRLRVGVEHMQFRGSERPAVPGQ
jgi:hypothetical protein